jgi:hypothetical protein
VQIGIPNNPNCGGSDQFVFQELDAPEKIRGIKIIDRGHEIDCDVTGVDENGRWTQAFAVKITDSGPGYSYLIYGGQWGIRLRPAWYAAEPWDLSNPRQWGEPFKIYGERGDILYVDKNG